MRLSPSLINAPNQLTALRVALTMALYLVAKDQRWLLLALVCAAAGTDVLDGYLARRWGQETPFGRAFDSAADSFLLWSSLWMLWRVEPRVFSEHVAAWVAIIATGVIAQGYAYVRTGRPAAFHLFSSRVAACIAFFGFGGVLLFGYSPLVTPVFAASMLVRNAEILAICRMVKDPYADLRASVLDYDWRGR